MKDFKLLDARLAVSKTVYGETGVKIQCREPSHHDDTASCTVYKRGIVCYGCGLKVKGTLAALSYLLNERDMSRFAMMELAHSSKIEAYSVENALEGRPTHERGEGKRRQSLHEADVEVYENILHTVRRDRLEWLYERGFEEYTIRWARLGHTGDRFTIPIFDGNGNLLNIRSRLDPKYGDEYAEQKYLPKYKGIEGHNGNHLYPLPWVVQRIEIGQKSLYIVEGELDALLLKQYGYCAISMTNGASQMTCILDALSSFPQITKLYIVGDQDQIGRKNADACAKAASERGYRVIRVTWDVACGKDVTEYLTQGYSLQKATYVEVQETPHEHACVAS